MICESLRKMGIEVEEREDGLTVYPGQPRPVELNSYDDHRVAMSLSLIGARVPGVRILDPGCVSRRVRLFTRNFVGWGLAWSWKNSRDVEMGKGAAV